MCRPLTRLALLSLASAAAACSSPTETEVLASRNKQYNLVRVNGDPLPFSETIDGVTHSIVGGNVRMSGSARDRWHCDFSIAYQLSGASEPDVETVPTMCESLIFHGIRFRVADEVMNNSRFARHLTDPWKSSLYTDLIVHDANGNTFGFAKQR